MITGLYPLHVIDTKEHSLFFFWNKVGEFVVIGWDGEKDWFL